MRLDYTSRTEGSQVVDGIAFLGSAIRAGHIANGVCGRS